MVPKDKKEQIIQDLIDKFSRQKAVIFTDYTGLKVHQLVVLRKKLRAEGIDYQVAKKTLIDLALEKSGLKKIKTKDLPGQIGLVFGYGDEIQPAKIVYQFSQTNEAMKILSGLVKGEYLENQAIKALAKLPSREELLAQLIGAISAPLTGLVNSLEYNLRGLIYVLKNLKPEILDLKR